VQALELWKVVTTDRSSLLHRVLLLLDENRIRYCVIGGHAANAYADPLFSRDLSIAIAPSDHERLGRLLERDFGVRRLPQSLSIRAPESDLRVQLELDLRYATFVERSTRRPVLGLDLQVASLEDVLQGKIWAVQDAERRPSKRQKDLADIARLIETHPQLRERIPASILARLE